MTLKIIVPMPDWSMHDNKGSPYIDRDDPTNVVREVKDRLPMIPPWLAFNPALKESISGRAPGMAGTKTLMEWIWHREAWRKAVAEDKKKRFERRGDIEWFLRREHGKKVVATELKNRAHFFAESLKKWDRLVTEIKDSRKRAINIEDEFQERAVILYDEAKANFMMRIYLMYMAPSKVYTEMMNDKARDGNSLSRLSIAKAGEITHFDLLLKELNRMIPIIKKEEAEALLGMWQKKVDERMLISQDTAKIRKAITKAFYDVYMHKKLLVKLATKSEHERFFYVKREKGISLNKKEKSMDKEKELYHDDQDLKKERQNIYEDFLAANQIIDSYVDQLDYIKNLNDNHAEKLVINHELAVKHQNKLNSSIPTIVDGQTIRISRNPAHAQTQFGLVRSFMATVDSIKNRTDAQNTEHNELILQNLANKRQELNDSTYDDAVVAEKLIDVTNNRQLIDQFRWGDNLYGAHVAGAAQSFNQGPPLQPESVFKGITPQTQHIRQTSPIARIAEQKPNLNLTHYNRGGK